MGSWFLAMNDTTTEFGSLTNYRKGGIEVIAGRPSEYAFSNAFEVAAKAAAWEKIVVGKNLDYVVEVIRAEGTSPWYVNGHDEFAVVLDGEVRVEYVALDDAMKVGQGTHLLGRDPKGKPMGHVVLRRGHQTILPEGRAYRFSAKAPSVFLQQTILGPLSIQKWSDICLK